MDRQTKYVAAGVALAILLVSGAVVVFLSRLGSASKEHAARPSTPATHVAEGTTTPTVPPKVSPKTIDSQVAKLTEEAESLLQAAEKSIDERDPASAEIALAKYLASPSAKRFAYAKSLVAELQLVTSDAKTRVLLAPLGEDEFQLLSNDMLPSVRKYRAVSDLYSLANSSLLPIATATVIRNLGTEKTRRERAAIQAIILELEDEDKSSMLFLKNGDVGLPLLISERVKKSHAAAMARALGKGSMPGYTPKEPFKGNNKLRLEYLTKDYQKRLQLGELMIYRQWPPSYKGKENRIHVMAQSFSLAELVAAKSMLPDFKLSSFPEKDQESALEVFRFFDDVVIFGGLVYEASGNDLLMRIGR